MGQNIDRRREFRLPGIHELNKRQEDAISLPLHGQRLVVGGPGTGKSVVALHRAWQCHRRGQSYHFLVFNRPLNIAGFQIIKSSYQDQWELVSSTWDSWFREVFQNEIGKPCPKQIAVSPSSYSPIDWEAVSDVLANHNSKEIPLHLILDEGQDMPPDFYTALVNLGFSNFFVVADQNQQIISGKNSSRKEIEVALNIHDVIELDENFRNSFPIARVANEFYTGDPAVPRPALPAVGKSSKTPLLFSYREESHFTRIVARILKLADRNPRSLIGIITPNNEIRKRYLDALSQCQVELDHGKPPIQTYDSQQPSSLSFDQGGIMVLNCQACKGLEFDTVILADIEEHFLDRIDPDAAKRRFYVMVSRAKSQLIMLRKADRPCPIDPILPTDPTILERHGP